MGIDISACLVVGETVYKKNIEKKITKYDEDTGEPYIKIQKDKEWFFSDGEKIPDKKFGAYDIFYLNDNDNINIFGKIIIETESHRSREDCFIELTEENFLMKRAQLFEDYKKMYHRQPSVFLCIYNN